MINKIKVYSAYRIILKAKELNIPIAIINVGETRGDKYANIKMIIGKTPAKKDLQKYFQISNEFVTYKQYNISTNTFDVYNNTLFKYDDLIDSYLIATCL